MKVTLESTDKVVQFVVNGAEIPARIWQGTTDSGVEVHAFITRIAAPRDGDLREFQRELEAHAPPRVELQVYPLRLIL